MRIDMIGARSIPARHGGLEVAAEQLSLELAGRGHSVRALIDRGGELQEHRGIRIQEVGSLRTKHLHALTQTLSSLGPVLRDRPEIAHFHGVGPGMLVTVPKRRGVKTVVTVQALDWERDKWHPAARRVFGAGVGVTLRRADGVIAVSRSIQRAVQERLGITAHYIPNGVRLPDPVSTNHVLVDLGLERSGYILFAARLVQEKGLHYLFDAYRSLNSRLPLVVAGSGAGSYADDYERQLRASAPNGVIFAGFRSGQALQELFAHARLYVLPSVMEGLPLSLLEAMSHGLPVIHSDIPECEEVTRGDAGRSFRVRDARDLTRVLRELLDDDDASQALGTVARQRVAAEYSWSEIAGATERLYREVLGEN